MKLNYIIKFLPNHEIMEFIYLNKDIYKMFDKLIIFDVGGYPIYKGDPVDAVVYFKKLINLLRYSLNNA